MNCPQNPSNRKKGRSKRARVLLASVEEATWNLLDKGETIAKEATVLKEELGAALQEVREQSKYLAPGSGANRFSSGRWLSQRTCECFALRLAFMRLAHSCEERGSQLWEAGWLTRQPRGGVPVLALLWLWSLYIQLSPPSILQLSLINEERLKEMDELQSSL